ncbi:MAG: hypothetical protein JWN78_410 [Bacteroidota bacterium]|nr:hypothetical protein [Bacteroidota bacterium]
MATDPVITVRWRYSSDNIPPNSLTPGDGGIILKDIKHDNYSLAKEVSVIGFWVEIGEYKNGKREKDMPKQFLFLDKQTFKFGDVKRLKEVKPKITKTELYNLKGDEQTVMNELEKFNMYGFVGGSMRVTYTLTSKLSEIFKVDHIDFEGLEITQTFLFSRYSNDPAHEPSGGLTAARFFPLIKFNFTDKQKEPTDIDKPYYKIESFRADYRFHYNLEIFLKDEEGSHGELLKTLKDMGNDKPQQAGVFADNEQLNVLAGDKTFDAAEKPLYFEIIGDGLKKGISMHSDWKGENFSKFWDNIHWWGNYSQKIIPHKDSMFNEPYYDDSVHMISTPGGFHALHFHWRWGYFIQNKNPVKSFLSKEIGGSQFKSEIGTNGPLVDVNIPSQSLQFAIVENSKSPLSSKEMYDYESYFKQLPSPIREGKDLVLHLNISAHRTKANFNGTFLVHGLFFAHNEEDPNLKAAYAADSNPIYKHPNKTIAQKNQIWRRNPDYSIMAQ